MPEATNTERGGLRQIPVLAVSTGATMATALPVFLVGAMSVQIRETLGFGQTGLGLATASFFLASALMVLAGGRISEHFGARTAMRLALLSTAVAATGMAAGAQRWLHLMLLLPLAGLGEAISQPASNLALARAIAPDRQGIAFGIKQGCIPLATLLAGLAVPVFALTVGWRWAFAVAAALAVVLIVVSVSLPTQARGSAFPGGYPRFVDAKLLVLALAAWIGGGSATTLATFFVDSAVTRGQAAGLAGLLLSVGSGLGIVARIAFGWLVDRRAGKGMLALVAVLLVGGAVGHLLLAVWPTPLGLGVAMLLGFGGGWAWPGVMLVTVVSLYPATPASATAYVQGGVFLGGITVPIIFGSLAERVDYVAAWSFSTACLLAGAAAVLWVRSARHRDHPSGERGRAWTSPR